MPLCQVNLHSGDPCGSEHLSASTTGHQYFPISSFQFLLRALTLLPHARLEAFAKPTLLAFPSHVGVHGAVATAVANIACSLDDTAAEESLAALAAQHIVMEARSLVPTHTAQLIPQHFGGWPLFPLLWTKLWIQTDKMLNVYVLPLLITLSFPPFLPLSLPPHLSDSQYVV